MQPLKAVSIPLPSPRPQQQPEVILPSLKLLNTSDDSVNVSMADMVAAQNSRYGIAGKSQKNLMIKVSSDKVIEQYSSQHVMFSDTSTHRMWQ